MEKGDVPIGLRGPVWDLTRLYRDEEDPQIQSDLDRADLMARRFAADCKGRIGDLCRGDLRELVTAFGKYEEIHLIGMRPFLFAYLLQASDTLDHKRNRLFQKVKEDWEKTSKEITFFPLELRNLSEARLGEVADAPRVKPYRHYLVRAARWKPHTLSEPEENLLLDKDLSGKGALVSLFDGLVNSLSFPVEMEGEKRLFTRDQVLSLLYSPDGSLRERAFHELLTELSRHSLVFQHILNALLLDKSLDDQKRGHPDPLDRPHLEKEADRASIEEMNRVVEGRYPLARRFFRLKGRALGLNRLKNTDLFAPVREPAASIPFPEARRIVLEALGAVHPLFHREIEGFFEKDRIDALPRIGKRGGAFCVSFSPSDPPYISMNYTGALRDLLTLAHELGHGIHHTLASRESYLSFKPSLLLAETASTFCELLTIHHLLQEDSFRELHTRLMAARIEGAIITVFRQHVLHAFEREIHLARRGRLLSAEEISGYWWNAHKALYGEDVEMIPSYRWGWTYIPHFIHHPFYCYSYVFGYLVSVALIDAYSTEGRGFSTRFMELLAAGGSKAPLDLLAGMGFNPREKAFWEKAFQTISNWVDAYEEKIG
jgi:oligoendopeptidase F